MKIKIKVFFILFFCFFTSKVLGVNIKENSYMVIDYDSKTVLIEKNSNDKVYPASTTKILTCILALENLDMEQDVTVTKEMLSEVPKGSSTMKLVAGDKLKVKDLIYGLMMPSGNDSAVVLAHLISGSTEEFMNLMNKRLIELDCKNSHFTSPHGFHNDEHYTTAKDMAKLFMYALQNEKFIEIISTKSYTIKANNVVNYDRVYKSTNNLLYTSKYNIYGKTGYTDEAGNVFISYSEKDNYKLITILLDGDKNYFNNTFRFDDTLKINEYIHSNYQKKEIISPNNIKLQLIDRNSDFEQFYSNTDTFCSLNKDKSNITSYEMTNKSFLEFSANLNVKGINFYNNTSSIKLNKISESILKDSIINKHTIKNLILIILDVIFLLILLICLHSIISLSKPKKRKKIRKKYY